MCVYKYLVGNNVLLLYINQLMSHLECYIFKIMKKRKWMELDLFYMHLLFYNIFSIGCSSITEVVKINMLSK